MATRKFECEICKIYTSDQSTLENHFLGSKHQLALHRTIVRENKQKRGIYVTGLSHQLHPDDIRNFFSRYGKIDDCFIGNNNTFAVIEFAKEEVAQSLLERKIFYHGRCLNIKPRIIKDIAVRPPPKQNPEFAKIYQEVRKQPDSHSQIMHFIKILQVHEKYLEPPNYNRVCGDLEFTLRSKFPNCRVWPFGSTVSGLGFVNSDIDIYVDVVTPIETRTSEDPLPAVSVRMAKKVLLKSQLFKNVVGIPKAKTPIVKAVHAPTGINCDINFKNMLGVCNSNLIKFLSSLDCRVRPLIFIIKYWAKINEVSGSGKFCNYSIVMLAIFYLQKIPEPILPPIKVLLTREPNFFVEGWNVSFHQNPNIIDSTTNKLNIQQLLVGFFNFWSKFDFCFNVICPLTGYVVPKSAFSTPETLPDSFNLYKTNICNIEPLRTDTPVCLQDPLELNHNITICVSSRLLEDFQKLCEVSANIVNTSEPKEILPKLLLKLEFPKSVLITDNNCVFKISAATAMLPENISSLNIQKIWFEKVNQFLETTLTKLFLFETKEIRQNKAQKLGGQSDIHNNILECNTFHCLGYNNVWEARKSISKNFEETNHKSVLEKEIAISEYICNVLCKDLKPSKPLVEFNLTLNCKKDPTEAEFILNDMNSKKHCFRIMATFFANRIPSLFMTHLKESKNNLDDTDTKV